jgi:hypothetical protein
MIMIQIRLLQVRSIHDVHASINDVAKIIPVFSNGRYEIEN